MINLDELYQWMVRFKLIEEFEVILICPWEWFHKNTPALQLSIFGLVAEAEITWFKRQTPLFYLYSYREECTCGKRIYQHI